MIGKKYITYFLIFLINFLFLDAVFPLMAKIQADASGSEIDNSVYQVIASLLYFVSGLMLVKSWHHLRKLVYEFRLLFLLVALALFSTFWSIDPAQSAKSSIALLGTSLCSLFIVQRLSLRKFLGLLCLALLAANFLSLVAGVLFPEQIVHSDLDHYGLWRGVYYHKNVLARNSSLGIVVSAVMLLSFDYSSSKFTKPLLWLNLAFSCLLLFLSGGKSGLIIAAILIVLLYPILGLIQRSNGSKVNLVTGTYFATLIFVGSLAFIILNAEGLLQSIGGNLTLTGRTVLWVLLIPYVLNKFWSGYGYDAFWSSEEADFLAEVLAWKPPHAHSALIDLFLNIGLPGFLVFLLIIWKIFGRLSNQFFQRFNTIPHIMIMVYMLAYTIPGSPIVSHNSINWIFLFFLWKQSTNQEKAEV